MTLLRHSHSKIFVVNQVKKHLKLSAHHENTILLKSRTQIFQSLRRKVICFHPQTQSHIETLRHRGIDLTAQGLYKKSKKTSLEHNSENKQIQRTRLKSIYSFTIQRVLSTIQIKNINLLRRPKPNIIIKYGFDGPFCGQRSKSSRQPPSFQ